MEILSLIEAAASGLVAGLAITTPLAWAAARWAERAGDRLADRALMAPRVVDDHGPYEPTAEDWADYRAWCEARDEAERGHRQDFCPADFGEFCPDCDREQAETEAAEHDRAERSDGWYLDLVAQAAFPHSDWRD